MFLGEHQYNLDDKRRLGIPGKFREKLGSLAILTKGLDKCLFLFPKESFEEIVEKLKNLPLSQTMARNFLRILVGGACEVEFDSLGRILIPEYLKNYALLEKKVIVLGVINRIEIWNEKIWRDYQKKSEKNIEEMERALKDIGLI